MRPHQDARQSAVGRQFGSERRLEAVNSPASSSGSTTYFSARRPCVSAFCEERALPSGVFGPRDLARYSGWPAPYSITDH